MRLLQSAQRSPGALKYRCYSDAVTFNEILTTCFRVLGNGADNRCWERRPSFWDQRRKCYWTHALSAPPTVTCMRAWCPLWSADQSYTVTDGPRIAQHAVCNCKLYTANSLYTVSLFAVRVAVGLRLAFHACVYYSIAVAAVSCTNCCTGNYQWTASLWHPMFGRLYSKCCVTFVASYTK